VADRERLARLEEAEALEHLFLVRTALGLAGFTNWHARRRHAELRNVEG